MASSNKWISAAIKPNNGGPKLVFGLTETMGWGYSVESYDKTYGWTGRHAVTHWQDLPLPPAELSGG